MAESGKEKPTAIRVTLSRAIGFGPGNETSDQQGHGCYLDQHVTAFPGESTSPKGFDSHSKHEKGKPERGAGLTGKVGQNLLLRADGKPDRLTVKQRQPEG